MNHHQYPEQWTKQLFRTTDRRYAYAGETGAAFRSWQNEFREALRSALGLSVIEEGRVPDGDPELRDTTIEADHKRQDWRIQTEPGFWLPFYVLLPDKPDPPYPVAITLHGHGEGGRTVSVGEPETDKQRTHIVDERRDIALQAVDRGYAAVVPAMRGLAELANQADKRLGYRTCHTLQLHAQLFGRSLTGDRVWDTVRLFDFIESQTNLDDRRICVTGHSGGGAVALFTAAVTEQVDVAAVSSYFCTFEDSIAAIDHCECNYVPGVARLGELWDIAGLIAPRPLIALNGVGDEIFPIEGAKRAFEHLKPIYDAAGASEHSELYIGEGGHRYYPEGAWPFVRSHMS